MADGEPDFIIKRNNYGDLQPLRVTLKKLVVDEDGEPVLDEAGDEQFEPIDLTGKTVSIALEKQDESVRVKTSAMTGWDGKALSNNGRAEYIFEKAEGEDPADLAVDGDYDMDFEILAAGGTSLATVPNEGHYLLRVEDDNRA